MALAADTAFSHFLGDGSAVGPRRSWGDHRNLHVTLAWLPEVDPVRGMCVRSLYTGATRMSACRIKPCGELVGDLGTQILGARLRS